MRIYGETVFSNRQLRMRKYAYVDIVTLMARVETVLHPKNCRRSHTSILTIFGMGYPIIMQNLLPNFKLLSAI